jgi:hypothetical protein
MNEETFFYTIDGHDNAIIGRCVSSGRYMYSMQKILNDLVFEHGMTHEDADEFFWYNIERSLSYLGEGAPLIVDDVSWDITLLYN